MFPFRNRGNPRVSYAKASIRFRAKNASGERARRGKTAERAAAVAGGRAFSAKQGPKNIDNDQ